MMFGNIMYLRPGNLWKSFRVLKMHVDNVDGYAKNSYEDTGTIVDGILAQATSNERELTNLEDVISKSQIFLHMRKKHI